MMEAFAFLNMSDCLKYRMFSNTGAFYNNWIQWVATLLIALVIVANYHEFKLLSTARGAPFRLSLLPVLNVILVPVVYVSVPLFATYHLVVHIILSIKYGRRFGGILSGADAIIHLQNTCPMQTVLFFQYKNNSIRPFYDFAKDSLRGPFMEKFKHNPKVFGTVQSSCGYSFILKDEIRFDDCCVQLGRIHASSETLTKAEFTKLMSDNIKMPKNYKALWHMVVGSQPVKLNNETEELYPIIFKIDHVVADALHLLKTVLELFSELEMVSPGNPYNVKSFIDNFKLANGKESAIEEDSSLTAFLYQTSKVVKSFLLHCYIVLVVPAVTYACATAAKVEPNLLQGPQLLHDIFRCFNVEQSPYYIQAIKRIKSKFLGTTFEDVVLATFTASLVECYKKRSAPIPAYLLSPSAVAPEIQELIDLFLRGARTGNAECKNTALLTVRKLPTAAVADGTIAALIKGLEIMKNERQLMNKSVELQVAKFTRDVFVKILPEPILLHFVKEFDNYACSVSNVPGPPYLITLKECKIENLVPFTGHGRRVGISLMISSYDGRLQLSFGIDKALISDINEAQEIVDRILKYIDMLDTAPVPETNDYSKH